MGTNDFSTELLSMWLASTGIQADKMRLLLEQFGSPEAVAEGWQQQREPFLPLLNERELSLLKRRFDEI